MKQRKEKQIEKINLRESCLFEKINKIDKPLARLTEEKKEKTQATKIRHDEGGITTDSTERKDYKGIL